MNLLWRVAALKNGFRDATAYRWEFLLEVLGSAFVPAAIQWLLWYAIFKIGGAQQVAGMDYAAMLQYTFASLLFSQIRGGDQDFELAEMVRSGQLSNYLLRPVGIVEFVYVRGVAPKLLLTGIAFFFGMIASPWLGTNPLRLLMALFLALLGNIIHYQVGAALSTVSFVWEEAYSFLMVKNMLVSFLSGELIPLNLFPKSLQWIWKSTPFYLYVFGPVEIALGRWSALEFAHQVGIACLWMLGLWAVIKLAWGLGMRRYTSLGG